MNSPVLVTGGTGFIGGHVVRALVERGERVRCLVRPGSDRSGLDALRVELVEGDVTAPESLPPAVRGCRTVFHVAADYRLWSSDPSTLYATNVGGTRAVLEACATADVERVVHTSSVGTLPTSADGTPVDEDAAPDLAGLVGHYKRSKYLAERVAERWAERGLHVVIVNPSSPLGEEDSKPTPTGRMVVDFLRGRIPAYVDGGMNVVDVRDVAQGHLLAAERGTPGERYILGCRNVSYEDLFALLAEASGRKAPSLRVPHWLPLTAALASAAWARMRGSEPAIAPDAVRMSRKTMFFDSRKAVRELGLPQTPVEEAVERAVAWFRAQDYAA